MSSPSVVLCFQRYAITQGLESMDTNADDAAWARVTRSINRAVTLRDWEREKASIQTELNSITKSRCMRLSRIGTGATESAEFDGSTQHPCTSFRPKGDAHRELLSPPAGLGGEAGDLCRHENQQAQAIPAAIPKNTRLREKRERNQEAESCIVPEPGQVYCTYWQPSKQWYAVRCLPMKTTHDVEELKNMGLLRDHIPDCWVYRPQSKSISLKQGYEAGGPLFPTCQVPIMYFDGLPPEKSAVGWVEVRDLKVFDDDWTWHLIEQDRRVEAFPRKQRAERGVSLTVGSYLGS